MAQVSRHADCEMKGGEPLLTIKYFAQAQNLPVTKSNPNTQMDDSDERGDCLSPLKNHHQSIKGEKLSNLQSVMSTLAYIMQCERSIEWPF